MKNILAINNNNKWKHLAIILFKFNKDLTKRPEPNKLKNYNYKNNLKWKHKKLNKKKYKNKIISIMKKK